MNGLAAMVVCRTTFDYRVPPNVGKGDPGQAGRITQVPGTLFMRLNPEYQPEDPRWTGGRGETGRSGNTFTRMRTSQCGDREPRVEFALRDRRMNRRDGL